MNATPDRRPPEREDTRRHRRTCPLHHRLGLEKTGAAERGAKMDTAQILDGALALGGCGWSTRRRYPNTGPLIFLAKKVGC
jgi:hypothetical protein